MSELTSTRIRTTTAKLGLPHLAEALNQYVRRADEPKRGYLDLLDLVLSEELAVRDDRRFRNGLRLSKLPHHKTLEDYDFSVSCWVAREGRVWLTTSCLKWFGRSGRPALWGALAAD